MFMRFSLYALKKIRRKETAKKRYRLRAMNYIAFKEEG